MAVMKNFILIYNHAKKELEDILQFEDDVASATRRYGELETEFRDSALMDIVLVGSDSIETVKVTHANYFTGAAEKKVRDLFRSLNFA